MLTIGENRVGKGPVSFIDYVPNVFDQTYAESRLVTSSLLFNFSQKEKKKRNSYLTEHQSLDYPR